MDSWLKGLVAAACIVIVAGGAWFAWSRYQAQKQADEDAYYASCLRSVDNLREYEAGRTPPNAESEAVTRLAVGGCRQRFDLPAT